MVINDALEGSGTLKKAMFAFEVGLYCRCQFKKSLPSESPSPSVSAKASTTKLACQII